jgi:hypothetical protein
MEGREMKYFLIFAFSISALAHAKTCRKVFMETNLVLYQAKLIQYGELLKTWDIEHEALSGNKTQKIDYVGKVLNLTWHDFEDVKKPYEKFYSDINSDSGNSSAYERAFVDALKEFQQTEKYQKLIKNFDINRADREQMRTPFLLAYDSWFSLFKIYNRFVPGIFPEYRPIGYKRSQKIAQEGRTIVKDLEKRFETEIASTGYSSMEEYQAAIKAVADGKKALRFFSEEQVDLVIRRPEGARFWAEKVGFQNQRLTGASRGTYNPKIRDKSEARMIKMPIKEYAVKDVELKPKYGALMPKYEFGYKINPKKSSDRQYGADLWILKDEIKPFVTVTPCDSLSVGIYLEPGGTSHQQPKWAQTFIPWKYREILAPYVLRNIGNQKILEDLTPTNGPAKFAFKGFSADRYFEIQIWRDVTLNDVKAFVFTDNPPDAETAATLRKYGIKIYQQKGTVRTEWKGDR